MTADGNLAWSRDATVAVCALAATERQFTVDEVWAWMNRSTAGPPADSKALGGIMRHLSDRLGVVSTINAWQSSARQPDRPIRVWVGTGKPHPEVSPTENDVVRALEALASVGQERSRMLVESVRAARKAAS